jgi:nanoRNase/pAp phosphatase (c-di-AMP/oligoRNAs hydrolase)
MKRRATSKTVSAEVNKRQKLSVPDYHLTPTRKDSAGKSIWPVPHEQIQNVRNAIRECAIANQKTLIVPDKDADGLTSGVILYRTLRELGLKEENIEVHFVSKGNVAAGSEERIALQDKHPAYIFVLDQGSWKKEPLIYTPHKGIIIDHHYSEDVDFPIGSVFASACHYPPVATSSLLTYIICAELSPIIAADTQWLCAIGTHGDLGNTFKWEPPFPDMKVTFKQHTKAKINTAISLLNAPRRTPKYDVASAWSALLAADGPDSILKNRRLLEARAEVNAEVERCTHTPPKFSSDGRIAMFRISSAAQVHPVIATRWAGHLKSAKLQIVLVANEGYLAGKVNFSCRIARCAKTREGSDSVNIIEILKNMARRDERGTLMDELGESFARGHKEASGGIVPVDAFERFVQCLDLVERAKKDDKAELKESSSPQKNTLMNYFQKI